MENDANFDDTLKKLSDQVNELADTSKVPEVSVAKPASSGGGGILPKLSSPMVYYGLIPVGILIALFLWKPGFLMVEEPDEAGVPQKKMSYSKLLGWTLAFTALVAVAIFAFKYKQSKAATEEA